MQISSATLSSGILTSLDQQVTSAGNTSSIAGVTFISTLTTMGFNSGDRIYWVATGTGVNSTGSAVVTNTLGIVGSAVISIPITDAIPSGSFNVFILNAQVGGTTLKETSVSVLNSYNAGTYGWWGGGVDSTTRSQVDRIDFANDTITASPRGPLSQNKTQMGAGNNASYGWFTGGYTPTVASTVDRIDFTNDTIAASVRGPLTTARHNSPVPLFNYAYIWVAGGDSSLTSIERITMSNDTIATSPRGNLINAPGNSAGTSNSSFGWVTGGNSSSRVERVDFANDTASASVRGPLSGKRGLHGFAGNNNYGWAMAGCVDFPAPVLSSVERITYANDTAVGSPRSVLPAPLYVTGAAGNQDYGWIGHGENSVGAVVSTVYRVNYANDTATGTTRGPMSTTKQVGAATSNYTK